MAEEGSVIGGLKSLFNGEIMMERDGMETSRARDGATIDEFSSVQFGPVTTVVSATKPCRYVFWPGDELLWLLYWYPGMNVAMKHDFSVGLMRQLTV